MDYNVKEYGAIGDGIFVNTTAIQNAIDACNKHGGGRVVLENGVFVTGTLYMKSNVELYVDVTATILGSPNIDDYTQDTHVQLYRNETALNRCLIFCENLENIAFSGRGVIDGNGAAFCNREGRSNNQRPMLLRYLNCTNIHISDLRLMNPASWTNAFILCNKIWVRNITIRSRVNGNGDGLDFDACQNVYVSDCDLDCSDDCICLQNSEEDRVCKNIVITNCIMCSKWAGMRIGLLSCGDIENLTVTNCIFRDIGCSALKIQASEGANVQNLLFENLIMENVQRPLFITQNYYRERINRPEDISTKGSVHDVYIHNVIATAMMDTGDAGKSCVVIDAEDDGGIRNIHLSDFYMTVQGGMRDEASLKDVPTHNQKRAECFNYKGQLPAYGLFARNSQNIKLTRFRVSMMRQDEREMVCTINSTIEKE